MTGRQRIGLTAITVGLLVAVLGLVWTPAPPGDFGAAPAVAAPASEPGTPPSSVGGPVSPPPSVRGPVSPTPSVEATASPPTTSGTEGTSSAATAAPSPPAATGPPTPDIVLGERPVEVRLDRWDVSAPVDEVFAVDGILQVPTDPQRLGWWSAGAWVGAGTGTVVVDGHLDSATRGVGFLVRLRDLVEGDTVTVVTESGGSVSYAVTGRQTLPKSAGLPVTLFARDGPPSLLLITCGGPFDAARGTYEDNVAVTARPL